MATDDRLHAMDNLRALAMLAGVLFHAALAYSPLIHPYFPTADRAQSPLVDVVAWFFHLFRMPVFFVVAGYFTARLVAHRGLGGMFRDRLRRIGLTFVLFLPPVTWALAASTRHAAQTVANPSPVLAWVDAAARLPDPPQLPPGTGHLWFLYYLGYFYVLLWIARTLLPGALVRRVQGGSAVGVLCVSPLLLAPMLAAVSAPHPAPEGFLPQFWALGFFGAFFAAGLWLHGREAALDRLRPVAWMAALGGLALHGVFLLLLDGHPPGPSNPTAGWRLALVQACASVWSTFACVVGAHALLRARHALLRYLADASYWVYLVHLPVLFVVQYRLMDLDWPWWRKFAVAVAATLAVCLVGYELLVRRTPLARLVGVASRARPAAESPAHA
jgi:glucan biosynthesis protein C